MKRSGQSIVEYVVLLALVAMVTTAVLASVGQRSGNSVAQANQAMGEARAASEAKAPASKKPVVGSVAAKPDLDLP